MNKKIAIIVQYLGEGGAERTGARLSTELAKKGFDPVVIIFRDIIDYEYAGKLYCLDHNADGKGFISRLFAFLKRIQMVRKIKKMENVFATISLMENANFVNILSRHKDKVIISTRNNIAWMLQGVQWYKVILMKILYRFSDKYVLLSKRLKYDASKLLGMPEKKIKIVYNPIDVNNISELAKEDPGKYAAVLKSPSIINVGRLTKQKGQWYLIRIFNELKKSFPELKLLILGIGYDLKAHYNLKAYLPQLAKEYGLKTYVDWENDEFNSDYDVYFTGFLKNPYSLISRSKLFLFPSLNEGLGNAQIEAMACKVPVLSADCLSGPRDILAPDMTIDQKIPDITYTGCGVLLPAFEEVIKSSTDPLTNKETLWVKAVSDLLNDNEQREQLSEKGFERSLFFDADKIIEDWINVINE